MPISEPPLLGIDDGELRKTIETHLGFDAIDYVVILLDRIGHYLELRDKVEAIEEWTADATCKHIWEVADPGWWFELRLDKYPFAETLDVLVQAHGGTVTWSDGGPQ